MLLYKYNSLLTNQSLRRLFHSNAKLNGISRFSAIVIFNGLLDRTVYLEGKTTLGDGTGSPSFQPSGKSTPTVIVTRYCPDGNRPTYSPSLERDAKIGRPLAGKKVSVPLEMVSPRYET